MLALPPKAGKPYRNTHERAAEFAAKRAADAQAKERRRQEREARPRYASRAEYLRARFAADPSAREVYRRQDHKRAAREPDRALFKHIRQGLRQKHGPHFSARLVGVLGYDAAAFRARIEEQLTEGMTWELFVAGQVHLDHRVPLATLDRTTPAGIRRAWALSNLRPLWPEANRAKLKQDHQAIGEVRAYRRWKREVWPTIGRPPNTAGP